MIEIGKSYTIEQVVTPEMTARAIGSGGLEVFGTPFMMAMMEHAAMDCVQPDLPEGKGTVGVDIHSSHLAPTPVGMKVTATARLRSMERRKLWFDIEVNDEKGKCGEGSHLRIIVNSKAISEKAANKAENG